MFLCLSLEEFKCTSAYSPLAYGTQPRLGALDILWVWGWWLLMIFCLRSGAASHHDSPRLRPDPGLQRVRPDGDGRAFLSRGTLSHPPWSSDQQWWWHTVPDLETFQHNTESLVLPASSHALEIKRSFVSFRKFCWNVSGSGMMVIVMMTWGLDDWLAWRWRRRSVACVTPSTWRSAPWSRRMRWCPRRSRCVKMSQGE